MQVGEKRLALAQHGALRRQRLLHLDDHVGDVEHLRGIGKDSCADAAIVVVGDAHALGGARLHEHLMSVGDELARARRHQADAVLVDLDLFRHPDAHAGSLQKCLALRVLAGTAMATREVHLSRRNRAGGVRRLKAARAVGSATKISLIGNLQLSSRGIKPRTPTPF